MSLFENTGFFNRPASVPHRSLFLSLRPSPSRMKWLAPAQYGRQGDRPVMMSETGKLKAHQPGEVFIRLEWLDVVEPRGVGGIDGDGRAKSWSVTIDPREDACQCREAAVHESVAAPSLAVGTERCHLECSAGGVGQRQRSRRGFKSRS
jgi:hypothetical protein